MVSYPVRSFAYGEVAKAYAGRTDAPFYHQSCRLMENFLPLPYGPAEKRPGTIYAGTTTSGTMFDRGDCESATAPMVAGETVPYTTNCTWARDGAQKHAGTYSFKFTKSSDSESTAYFVDNITSGDLHGFVPGRDYTFSMWLYLPTGIGSDEIEIQFGTGALVNQVTPTATRDGWQQLTFTVTLSPLAIDAFFRLVYLSVAGSSGKFFYVDDITVTTTASDSVVLHDWNLSATSGMVLVFGHRYIHFYKNGAKILSGGNPYSVTTTYLLSELPSIRIKQVTSYAYITCPGHKEAKLTRTADDNWTLADVTNTAGAAGTQDFSTDYPALVESYEDRLILAKTPLRPATFYGSVVSCYENFSLQKSKTVTITIATPGVVTWEAHGLQASGTVLFLTTGALPTGLTAGTTYYVVGSSMTPNTFQVSATAGGVAINTSGTQSGAHTGYTETPLSTAAWEKTPQVKQNNEIMWIVAGDAFLFGTTEGIYRVGGKESMLNPDVAWWPNVQANTGTSDVPAIMVDDFVAYVGRGGRHIYRFQYSQAVDQYVADPITQLVEHRAKKIIGIVHQRHPESILWAWTSDGVLLAGCYSRSGGTIGWSVQPLGGAGLVESACVIPTNVEDEVWLSVMRTVTGSTVRHIERLAAREWDLLEDYHGVDAAVVVDNGTAKTVTSITNADPAVCTATLHGFANDDKVRFAGITGLTGVNGVVYTVKNKTDNTFQLYNEAGTTAIDLSGQEIGPGGTAGTVEKVSKVVTGLTHLEGETVKTWGDGAVVADEVVAGGAVTLDSYCNKIRTGLAFTAALEPMPVSEERNRLKQVKKAFLTFQKTANVQVGRDAAHMVDVKFTYPDALYTDGADEESEAKNVVEHYSRRDCTIRIGSSGPGPLKVTSLILELGEMEA